MNHIPSSFSSNQFSILPVYNITGIDESDETAQVIQPVENLPTERKSRPNWEKCLPTKLVIAALEETKSTHPRSLNLKVSIKTTDTGVVKSLNALLDSGATGCFIDRDYIKANGMTTRTLSTPIPVRNADGTPNSTGTITEVVDLILRNQNHSERTLFAVTGLGSPRSHPRALLAAEAQP